MTKAEMYRRLAALSTAALCRIDGMIEDGYGAHGISLETPYSLKQINAVFAWRQTNEAKRFFLHHDSAGNFIGVVGNENGWTA